MARLKYDIVPVASGWSVSCNSEPGPAYSTQSEAVLDTLAVAAQLRTTGDTVEVRLLDTDQPGRIWRRLEPQDARLFRR